MNSMSDKDASGDTDPSRARKEADHERGSVFRPLPHPDVHRNRVSHMRAPFAASCDIHRTPSAFYT
jgi:hypothetical protein